MLWLILAIINAIGYAVCGFFDNYITDVIFKARQQQACKIFYGITYIIVAVTLALIFSIDTLPVSSILLLILAGVISSTASIPYYSSLKHIETTTASIFLQLTPVIYLIAGGLFFGEHITTQQIIGFLIVIAAPAVIVLSQRSHKKRKAHGIKLEAAGLLLLYVVLAAISGTVTAHAGGNAGFITIFIWYTLGRGTMDLIYYFFNPKWHQRFRHLSKRDGKRLYTSLTISQAVFLIAEFAGRYALIIGIPAIVSVVSNALEMIIVFVLGIILSIIIPVFGREKLDRRAVTAHLIATILAVTGIIVLK